MVMNGENLRLYKNERCNTIIESISLVEDIIEIEIAQDDSDNREYMKLRVVRSREDHKEYNIKTSNEKDFKLWLDAISN
jgi:hypothetical protein